MVENLKVILKDDIVTSKEACVCHFCKKSFPLYNQSFHKTKCDKFIKDEKNIKISGIIGRWWVNKFDPYEKCTKCDSLINLFRGKKGIQNKYMHEHQKLFGCE